MNSALGDLDVGRAAVAGGDDLDPDRHRRAADLLDLGIDRDHVAQVDRRDELHLVDRDRRDRTVGAARGDDAGGDVHLAQHPAAEDMAVGVDVARAGDDAQDRRSRWDSVIARPFGWWCAGVGIVAAAVAEEDQASSARCRAARSGRSPSAVAISIWM